MKYTTLPNTDIKVSKICLGTMTWGNQNTKEDAFEQMNYALDNGVNFFDTAEMYAVPPSLETQGLTETYIGKWFQETGNRDKVVLATKVAGPSRGMTYIRENLGFSKEAMTEALHQSLQRLQTDYIDLYQLHWPERGVNCFGQREYPYKTSAKEAENHLEILETLNGFIKEGKIRQIGISNETPWGTMKYLQTAEKHDLPKMITVQNSYSLIHRSYEYGMSEVSLRENIGLLAYSPLAFGILSGKYRNGNKPKGARVTEFPRYSRYSNEGVAKAVDLYHDVAQKHGITLTELALAFVNQMPFVTSNIIGATKMEQLKENIGSINVTLSDEILKEIEVIHQIIPNPGP